ncbi:putative O-methyltransferase [Daldinia caldariorum]|uniref:putative O-methyltransferase n=1 Tax=Daldinia caldariorum TaxID=326644 RepID=UPI0020074753|nr:putative O-methyltransferase [Daldinia caldariorum]KAI1472981.1 putative O-methyltransferase [Daldinia caldariorum]
MGDSYSAVISKLDAFTATDFEGNEPGRLQLITTARKLVSRLETRHEKIFNIDFRNPVEYAVIRVCLDIGLWRQWTVGGGGEKTVEELAKLAEKDIEVNLLRRLLRLLGATYIIEETGEDRYKPTEFSLSFGDESTTMPSAIIAMSDHWSPASMNLPSFLAKTSYREPLDPKNSNYIDAFPEKLSFFDRCLSNQRYQDGFSGFMMEWSLYRISWPEFYDTTELVAGADLNSGAPLLVDIGGHHGHDISNFLKEHPDVPAGSLVIQDLEAVLADAHLDTDKVKLMPHSFFEPQPIHGSRAYFLRGIFHDWAYEPSLQILKNIIPAMKKGYSKLLVCDVVIPPSGASTFQTGIDLNMMTLLSAYERTEALWRKLLNDAGYKIIKIWMDHKGYEGLIEAELA